MVSPANGSFSLKQPAQDMFGDKGKKRCRRAGKPSRLYEDNKQGKGKDLEQNI